MEFLSWHFLISCQEILDDVDFVTREGKCHCTAQKCYDIFEKSSGKKNLILNLLLDLGQIKSGKWTRGDRRKNTIVLFCVVVLVYKVGDIQDERGILSC